MVLFVVVVVVVVCNLYDPSYQSSYFIFTSLSQEKMRMLLLPMGKWNSVTLRVDVWKATESESGSGPLSPGTVPFYHTVLDKNHNIQQKMFQGGGGIKHT